MWGLHGRFPLHTSSLDLFPHPGKRWIKHTMTSCITPGGQMVPTLHFTTVVPVPQFWKMYRALDW